MVADFKLEIWKDIKGYEGLYQVSNLGRVKSFITHKILVPCNTGQGYKKIKLSHHGKQKSFKIHRLVADAFIPNELNLPHVNHKNRKRDDNRVENLEWVTQGYNTKYSYDEMYKDPSYRNPRIILSDEQLDYIIKNYKKGSKKYGGNALARQFNVSQPTIVSIANKSTKYMKEEFNGTRKRI